MSMIVGAIFSGEEFRCSRRWKVLGGESGCTGQPEAFARRLRNVLDGIDAAHRCPRLRLGQLHMKLSQLIPR